MTTILHLSFSPRGLAAESHRLSQRIVDHLMDRHPKALVVQRLMGDETVPPIDAAYATSQSGAEDVSQEGSMARSEALIRALEQADTVVIGTPMHNMTVPASLKWWIDHVVRARKSFNVTPAGKVGLLSDRPVFIAMSSGGRFTGERARQPDFLTPYLRAVLGTIGLCDLTFFSIQGTGAGAEAVSKAWVTVESELARHFQ
ncbi:FMN-dependent NADH-azoreductase [Caulobacter segnis]